MPSVALIWMSSAAFSAVGEVQAEDEALGSIAEAAGLSKEELRSVLRCTWSGLELLIEARNHLQ